MELKCALLLCLLIKSFETKQFRCDYTYSKNSMGWYKLHPIAVTWDLAKKLCTLEGADLVKPSGTNKDMGKAIQQLMQKKNVASIHTDYRLFIYRTPTRKELEQQETDNYVLRPSSPIEQILTMHYNGTYDVVDLHVQLPFMCHKKDNDITDMTECGTVDSGYILNTRTDRCYKFHRLRDNWSNAFMTCMAEGGDLAVINSAEEAEVIMEVFEENPPESIQPGWRWVDSAFLGFFNVNSTWITTNGKSLSMSGYNTWSPGEPNNANGDELCGTVGRNGLLYDDPCNRELAYICEMEKSSLIECNDSPDYIQRQLLFMALIDDTYLTINWTDVSSITITHNLTFPVKN